MVYFPALKFGEYKLNCDESNIYCQYKKATDRLSLVIIRFICVLVTWSLNRGQRVVVHWPPCTITAAARMIDVWPWRIVLSLCMLGRNSSSRHFEILSYFYQKIEPDFITVETICIKVQALFSGEKRENKNKTKNNEKATKNKKKQAIFKMSSTNFAQRVLKDQRSSSRRIKRILQSTDPISTNYE